MKTKSFYLVIVLVLSSAFITSNAQSNTFYGSSSGTNDPIIGSYQLNSAFGINTLNSYTPGDVVKGNSAFGNSALRNNLGSYNSAFGMGAMQNHEGGSYNVALGFGAMSGGANAGGQFNIALGSRALERHTTGNRNIGIGHRTLEFTDVGNNNIGIGYYSLPNLSGNTSNNNIALGYWSGTSLTTASNNIIIGYQSGGGLSVGNNNILIGSSISFPSSASTATTSGNDTSNTIAIGTQGNQRIFVHNNGFTGIGLGNNVIPQNRLEIKAQSNNSGLRFRNYTSASPTVAPNGKVLTLNANGDVVLTTDEGGSGGGDFNIYENDGAINQSTTTLNNRRVNMNGRNIWFDTSTSRRNGNIYIGSQPSYPNITGNYRLYVEGGILTEKVKVALRSTANWADFVFESDYKLATLKEVEAFIKKNKHLPGVESADELLKNGLDIGNMQAKQMEKIEELTLYAIEQDKKLEKQSKEIEILKEQVKALLERQ